MFYSPTEDRAAKSTRCCVVIPQYLAIIWAGAGTTYSAIAMSLQILQHSKYGTAIEKLRCRKGSVGFESETSADRLSTADPRILNRPELARNEIIKD